MNRLNQLTLKSLKLNKKRTIVTIVGIMLSVALLTAVASIYASGLESLINLEKQKSGNFHAAFYDVPAQDLQRFRNNRKIEAMHQVRNLGYAAIASKNEYKPYVFLKEFAADSMAEIGLTLVEGRFPENAQEIVIPEHLRSNGRVVLQVGEQITLNLGKRVTADGGEFLADTHPVTFTVTGIIERPPYMIEPYTAPGYTLITVAPAAGETPESATVPAETFDLYVRFTPEGAREYQRVIAGILGMGDGLLADPAEIDAQLADPAEIDAQLTAQEGLGAARYLFDVNYPLIDAETNPLAMSSVDSLLTVLLIVVAIIVVTSVFCIKNSFDISITEKIRQYGMLRSIGATRKQIRKNVYYEAAVLGVIGIPCGIVLGFLASWLLVMVSNYYIAGIFYSGLHLEFVFSWLAMAVAAGLGIVTVYLSAGRSAAKASRISPIDSIRNSTEITIRPKNVKCPVIVRKLFGAGGVISWKNLKRNRRKYRTTVISIAVSATVFIALSSFMGQFSDAIMEDRMAIDYNLSMTIAYSGDVEEAVYQKMLATADLDGVEEFSVVRNNEVCFSGEYYNDAYLRFVGKTREDASAVLPVFAVGEKAFADFTASMGLDAASMQEKAILCDYGTMSRPGEEEEIEKQYMRVFNSGPGDVLEGTIGDAPVQIPIGAVSEEVPFGLRHTVPVCLVVSDALFDRVAEACRVEAFYRTAHADQLQDAIETMMSEEAYHLINLDKNYREIQNFRTLIGIFLYGFIIVISLIGITNIFNTITTNMELRRREFAMLRSVGMTGREFNRMIRLESLFTGTRSLLFAIPAGVLLSYVIYHFLTEDSGQPFRLPLAAIGISVAVVFAIIWLLMVYSLNKSRRHNIIETIRNENI